MAFDVTPTSGDAPYLFTAVLSNKVLFETANFALEFRANQGGTCNLDVATGASSVEAVDSILLTGSYTVSNTVAAGQCRTFSLIVRDLISGDIIDSQNVYVDNT